MGASHASLRICFRSPMVGYRGLAPVHCSQQEEPFQPRRPLRGKRPRAALCAACTLQPCAMCQA